MKKILGIGCLTIILLVVGISAFVGYKVTTTMKGMGKDSAAQSGQAQGLDDSGHADRRCGETGAGPASRQAMRWRGCVARATLARL